MTKISWELPIVTISEANAREHWTIKYKRHRRQEFFVKTSYNQKVFDLKLPCQITFTRLSSREMDDDNLIISFKHIRDCIADCIIPGKKKGRADSDPRLKWHYKQEKSKEKSIRIEIEFD